MFKRLLLSDGPSRRELPAAALPDYFEQVFFHCPSPDEELSPLVYQESDGRIVGFLGVASRRMMLRDRPIRMAVSFHFMVESESRSTMAGVQLLRTFFSGPQDLSLTDGAGHIGRKVWEGVGGATAFLYSQFWTRILKPTQHIADLFGRRKILAPLARALSPLCYVADKAVRRALPRYFPEAPTQYSEEELDVETLLHYLPQFSKTCALWPVYDDCSLRWLLAHADRMKHLGDFKKVLVRDSHGDIAGWFMYYLKPGGTSVVFQFVARKNATNEILDHLFNHASRHGSVAITGRLHPRYMHELSEKLCYFHRRGSWVLVHSNIGELLNIIHRGDAFLTGLEGESCLLF
ncbi:MAG TPA: hypothetical protein VJ810_18140 [Blastocatellia bacterium]|nr:hypothetical protein [Blastocatellia bacterium]